MSSTTPSAIRFPAQSVFQVISQATRGCLIGWGYQERTLLLNKQVNGLC